MSKIIISKIQILLTAVIVLLLCSSAYSQGNTKQTDITKAFIAVLRITIPDSFKISGKEWYPKLPEELQETLIIKNSEILSGNAANTVWYMDTVISGSRFNATVYSGITSRTIRNKIQQNSIFLYSPENTGEDRVINGILMYLRESDGGIIECVMDDELFDKQDSDK
jgi:hypothetical protein